MGLHGFFADRLPGAQVDVDFLDPRGWK